MPCGRSSRGATREGQRELGELALLRLSRGRAPGNFPNHLWRQNTQLSWASALAPWRFCHFEEVLTNQRLS